MVAVRNEKGQFVKKEAVVEVKPVDLETAKKDFQQVIVANVKKFAEEVYGKMDQKHILKAYRTMFDASYQEAYAWARINNLEA